MVELRAEDVREALEWIDALHPNSVFVESPVLPPLVAAAREWLASQEQISDIEKVEEWCEGDRKATVADLVAALIAEGGETVTTDDNGNSVWMRDRTFAPGSYLIYGPLDKETR